MLTQTQLADKRKNRTMSSRTKSKAKAARIGRHLEDQAQARSQSQVWLSDLARQQKARTPSYAPGIQDRPAPLGIMARARAFILRSGRGV